MDAQGRFFLTFSLVSLLHYKLHVCNDNITSVLAFCPSVASFISKCQSSFVNSERMFMQEPG